MKQNKNNDHKYAVLTRINNDNTVMNFYLFFMQMDAMSNLEIMEST